MADFPRQDLAEKVAALASSRIYVGTSSWKYEGRLGLIYTQKRYLTRGMARGGSLPNRFRY